MLSGIDNYASIQFMNISGLIKTSNISNILSWRNADVFCIGLFETLTYRYNNTEVIVNDFIIVRSDRLDRLAVGV